MSIMLWNCYILTSWPVRIATFLQFDPVVKLTESFPGCLAALMVIIYRVQKSVMSWNVRNSWLLSIIFYTSPRSWLWKLEFKFQDQNGLFNKAWQDIVKHKFYEWMNTMDSVLSYQQIIIMTNSWSTSFCGFNPHDTYCQFNIFILSWVILYIDFSIDSRPLQLNCGGWNCKGFIYPFGYEN